MVIGAFTGTGRLLTDGALESRKINDRERMGDRPTFYRHGLFHDNRSHYLSFDTFFFFG